MNQGNNIQRLLKIARENGDEDIDFLKGRELRRLPSSLWELRDLKRLDLSQNKLSSIPDAITKLSSLEWLNLSNNQLEQIPDCIYKLSNLQILLIAGNKIGFISDSIFKLRNLRIIDLSKNLLQNIPEPTSNSPYLEYLEWLDVSHNQLESMPSKFMEFEEIRVLDLSNNRLEVFNFDEHPSNIECLNLSRNGLRNIPKNIEKFENLRILNLSCNQLAEINLLPSLFLLEWLDISHNRIRRLPENITNLSKLTTLNVSSNFLKDLPKTLDVSDNDYPYKALSLIKFDIRGNTIGDIPDDILNSQKFSSIITYYFDQTRNEPKTPLNEVKVILVGESDVGKTSLVKRLTIGNFRSDEPQTKGIEISTHDIHINNDKVKIHYWDFAGQTIKHSAHKFFLTERSLYLFVTKNRVDYETANRIDYWLEMIDGYGKDSPIVFIGNFSDQRGLDLDKVKWQTQYPNIVGFFETSCLKGDGINELKEAIEVQIRILKADFPLIPERYLNVKSKLDEMSGSGNKKYIIYRDYESICKDNGIQSKEEIQELAKILHDLGVILYFSSSHAPEPATVVLDPKWIVDDIYEILGSEDLRTEKEGKLDLETLRNILLPSEGGIRTDQNMRYVIDIMVEFELCFEIDTNPRQYLVVDLLPKTEKYKPRWENYLKFVYQYTKSPQRVISRFFVKNHSSIRKGTIWRTGVLLDIKGRPILVKIDDKKIIIKISNEFDAKHLITARKEVLGIILHCFDEIHENSPDFCKENAVKQLIRLPDEPEVLVSYYDVLKAEQEGKPFYYGADRKYSVKEIFEGVPISKTRNSISQIRESDMQPQEPDRQPRESDRQSKQTNYNSMSAFVIFAICFIVILVPLVIAAIYVERWWLFPVIMITAILVIVMGSIFTLISNGNINENIFRDLTREILKRATIIQTLTDSIVHFLRRSNRRRKK